MNEMRSKTFDGDVFRPGNHQLIENYDEILTGYEQILQARQTRHNEIIDARTQVENVIAKFKAGREKNEQDIKVREEYEQKYRSLAERAVGQQKEWLDWNLSENKKKLDAQIGLRQTYNEKIAMLENDILNAEPHIAEIKESIDEVTSRIKKVMLIGKPNEKDIYPNPDSKNN